MVIIPVINSYRLARQFARDARKQPDCACHPNFRQPLRVLVPSCADRSETWASSRAPAAASDPALSAVARVSVAAAASVAGAAAPFVVFLQHPPAASRAPGVVSPAVAGPSGAPALVWRAAVLAAVAASYPAERCLPVEERGVPQDAASRWDELGTDSPPAVEMGGWAAEQDDWLHSVSREDSLAAPLVDSLQAAEPACWRWAGE